MTTPKDNTDEKIENALDEKKWELKRKLQLLKGQDGEWVVSSLTTPQALYALVDFITQAEQEARIDEHMHFISQPDKPRLLTKAGYLYHQDRLKALQKGQDE